MYELSSDSPKASTPLEFEDVREEGEQQEGLWTRCSSWSYSRYSSSTSGEIQIHLPISALEPQDTATECNSCTFHPLMISPPSPVPEEVLKMPKTPQRATKPVSLRLLPSTARNKDLTTSVVLMLAPDRPETAKTHQTQLHTGYRAASRTKYGRGKYSTTELVPQPSDDPQDPLVSTNSTHAQNSLLTIPRIGTVGGRN